MDTFLAIQLMFVREDQTCELGNLGKRIRVGREWIVIGLRN